MNGLSGISQNITTAVNNLGQGAKNFGRGYTKGALWGAGVFGLGVMPWVLLTDHVYKTQVKHLDCMDGYKEGADLLKSLTLAPETTFDSDEQSRVWEFGDKVLNHKELKAKWHKLGFEATIHQSGEESCELAYCIGLKFRREGLKDTGSYGWREPKTVYDNGTLQHDFSFNEVPRFKEGLDTLNRLKLASEYWELRSDEPRWQITSRNSDMSIEELANQLKDNGFTITRVKSNSRQDTPPSEISDLECADDQAVCMELKGIDGVVYRYDFAYRDMESYGEALHLLRRLEVAIKNPWQADDQEKAWKLPGHPRKLSVEELTGWLEKRGFQFVAKTGEQGCDSKSWGFAYDQEACCPEDQSNCLGLVTMDGRTYQHTYPYKELESYKDGIAKIDGVTYHPEHKPYVYLLDNKYYDFSGLNGTFASSHWYLNQNNPESDCLEAHYDAECCHEQADFCITYNHGSDFEQLTKAYGERFRNYTAGVALSEQLQRDQESGGWAIKPEGLSGCLDETYDEVGHYADHVKFMQLWYEYQSQCRTYVYYNFPCPVSVPQKPSLEDYVDHSFNAEREGCYEDFSGVQDRFAEHSWSLEHQEAPEGYKVDFFFNNRNYLHKVYA